jgi:hypothetical protein
MIEQIVPNAAKDLINEVLPAVMPKLLMAATTSQSQRDALGCFSHFFTSFSPFSAVFKGMSFAQIA